MELFYSPDMGGGFGHLGPEESVHCVKVLRHRTGDRIHVIDGEGTQYLCELVSDSPKGVDLMVLSSEPGWGSHPYHLTLAVCPTKNNDRYEWFAEKATELAEDCLVRDQTVPESPPAPGGGTDRSEGIYRPCRSGRPPADCLLL